MPLQLLNGENLNLILQRKNTSMKKIKKLFLSLSYNVLALCYIKTKTKSENVTSQQKLWTIKNRNLLLEYFEAELSYHQEDFYNEKRLLDATRKSI